MGFNAESSSANIKYLGYDRKNILERIKEVISFYGFHYINQIFFRAFEIGRNIFIFSG
ncbi:unnamed protein product [Meloidogyne enterolobii]|uniref:Uncharacterized protein n=1 Tax=Meloidogyne enterolobii TaxID=390850 RepID=A0ACB0ZH43_MELEN